MKNEQQQPELIRSILAVTILGLLLVFSFWVFKPFVPALIWATMISVATWPAMLAVQARLGGRRWAAVLVMTLAMLLVFVIPLSLAIGTLAVHIDDITNWVKSFDVHSLDTPPHWVAGLPMVGPRIDAAWTDLAASADLSGKIAPYAGDLAAWFLRQLGGLGAVAFQFLLTTAIAAILYANGETAGGAIKRCALRIGGPRGEGAVVLAAQAIRGVALGVVVTALAQSVLGGIGLAVVGIPYAGLLTAAMFLCAVAQIGAGPVLACAVIWLYWKDETSWATGLLVWTVIVSAMDNFLRPFLIRKGADLPILLIFVGVIGGLIAFGLVGLFIGPIVLAVTYTLAAAWIDEPRTPIAEQAAATTPRE